MTSTVQSPAAPRRASWLLRAAVIAGVVLVLAGAAYEAAVALGLVDLGTLPGEDAPGRGTLTSAVFLALLAGALVLAIAGLAGGSPDDGGTGHGSRRLLALPETAAVPLAAAAFFVAHHFSYDAYYAPTLRRFSVNLPVGLAVCVAIGGVLVAAGLRGRLTARPSALAGSALLLVILVGLVAGGGH